MYTVVQSLSCVWLLATPWTAACQASLSFTLSQSLLKLVSVESVMPFNHLILCHPFSSCLQSFLASRSFLMSWFFTSVGQSIGASALASDLPIYIMGWFLLGLTGLISLQSKELEVSSPTPQFKNINSLALSLFVIQLSHLYMMPGKAVALTILTFVRKEMYLLFNMLSRFVTAFLPRSKRLLISWLQSLSSVCNIHTHTHLQIHMYACTCLRFCFFDWTVTDVHSIWIPLVFDSQAFLYSFDPCPTSHSMSCRHLPLVVTHSSSTCSLFTLVLLQSPLICKPEYILRM